MAQDILFSHMSNIGRDQRGGQCGTGTCFFSLSECEFIIEGKSGSAGHCSKKLMVFHAGPDTNLFLQYFVNFFWMLLQCRTRISSSKSSSAILTVPARVDYSRSVLQTIFMEIFGVEITQLKAGRKRS